MHDYILADPASGMVVMWTGLLVKLMKSWEAFPCHSMLQLRFMNGIIVLII
jgi:hypothetical protein